MRVPTWKAVITYVEVWEITEWKNSCIFKTVSIGYAHKDDQRFQDQSRYVLSSLSTSITKGEEVELKLID